MAIFNRNARIIAWNLFQCNCKALIGIDDDKHCVTCDNCGLTWQRSYR